MVQIFLVEKQPQQEDWPCGEHLLLEAITHKLALQELVILINNEKDYLKLDKNDLKVEEV
jgi:hypothetical protein